MAKLTLNAFNYGPGLEHCVGMKVVGKFGIIGQCIGIVDKPEGRALEVEIGEKYLDPTTNTIRDDNYPLTITRHYSAALSYGEKIWNNKEMENAGN